MKFGVREICDVVFKANSPRKIGGYTFKKGQPVLFIDTATAASLEQATTTVYANGGKGNARLVAWEGEKTVTFTVTDALLSPIGLSILTGAGLFKKEAKQVHVHTTANAYIEKTDSKLVIDLTDALTNSESIDNTAPVFVVVTESDGSITGQMLENLTVASEGKKLERAYSEPTDAELVGKTVFVDFYLVKDSANVSELVIDPTTFGGNFYVEGSTLFRRQEDGVDMPANFTMPNVKIQSNMTFSMSATGDPSTFDFVMDAMPGYTMFNRTKKVQCVIQTIEDTTVEDIKEPESVMTHSAGFDIDVSKEDSTASQAGEASVG